MEQDRHGGVRRSGPAHAHLLFQLAGWYQHQSLQGRDGGGGGYIGGGYEGGGCVGIGEGDGGGHVGGSGHVGGGANGGGGGDGLGGNAGNRPRTQTKAKLNTKKVSTALHTTVAQNLRMYVVAEQPQVL